MEEHVHQVHFIIEFIILGVSILVLGTFSNFNAKKTEITISHLQLVGNLNFFFVLL